MKKVLMMCCFLFAGQAIFAQAWNGKGDQKLQAGINAWGFGSGITAAYDYGLSDLVSVGAGMNFYFSSYHNSGNNFFVFGRANFHFREILGLPEQWDLYPGVDLGVLGNTFGLGVHLGTRYFFMPKLGVFLEIGSNGSLGVSYNL